MAFQILKRASAADKHSDDINTIIFEDGKLYSGSTEGMIKMWGADLSLKKQVEAHSASIPHLAIGKSLYSCCTDGTVKSFDQDTLKEKSVILEEEAEMTRLAVVDNYLYIGDDEGVIYVCEHEKFAHILNLIEPCKDLIVVGNVIYAVRDLDVMVAEISYSNLGTYKIYYTFQGLPPLALAGDKLFLSTSDRMGLIACDNAKELNYKQCATSKNLHEGEIKAMVATKVGNDLVAYTGSTDKTIKSWKLDGKIFTPLESLEVDFEVNALIFGASTSELYAAGSGGNIAKIKI